MSLPVDPTRSALPPVAQFLAEAALQRQTALLGLDKPKPAAPTAPAPLHTADPSAPPPSVTSPSPPGGPLPTPADQASISPQAREQLAAGFDPRRPGGADGGVPGTRGDGAAQAGLSPALPRGATAAAPGNAAAPATATLEAGELMKVGIQNSYATQPRGAAGKSSDPAPIIHRRP